MNTNWHKLIRDNILALYAGKVTQEEFDRFLTLAPRTSYVRAGEFEKGVEG